MSAPQATTPAQAPSVVPVAKPAEVSAAAKSRDEAPKAEEQKKTAATTQGGATAPAAPTSKAATLTGSGGQGVNTLSPASAVPASTGPASAGAAPKAKSAPVPPMSAAAVVEEGKKPVTAAERLAGTGSALAKGVGAKAEPQAKPKAKAKMSAIPSRPLPTDTMGSAPTAVLNMVSGKPVPASQVGTSAYATSTVGPARAYAKAAAGAVSGEVPKAGPPAVAMGRAMAAGRPAMSMVNGKPVTTITKKYQLVFVTGEVAPFSKTGGLGEAIWMVCQLHWRLWAIAAWSFPLVTTSMRRPGTLATGALWPWVASRNPCTSSTPTSRRWTMSLWITPPSSSVWTVRLAPSFTVPSGARISLTTRPLVEQCSICSQTLTITHIHVISCEHGSKAFKNQAPRNGEFRSGRDPWPVTSFSQARFAYFCKAALKAIQELRRAARRVPGGGWGVPRKVLGIFEDIAKSC